MQRLALNKKDLQTIRNIKFRNQFAYMPQLFPGASNTKKRELATARMKVLGQAFVCAFDSMNEHQQRVQQMINRNWVEQVERCAADPSYACTTDARTLSATEASFLTNIMPGVWWSYLCRRRGCHFFGCNNPKTWFMAFHHYKFRCPMCTIQRQPWAGKDVVEGKRVLTVFSQCSPPTSCASTHHRRTTAGSITWWSCMPETSKRRPMLRRG